MSRLTSNAHRKLKRTIRKIEKKVRKMRKNG